MKSYLLKFAIMAASLQPRVEQSEIVEAVVASFHTYIRRHLMTSNIKTAHDALNILNKLEPIEIQEN